jgi:hypothetical protein
VRETTAQRERRCEVRSFRPQKAGGEVGQATGKYAGSGAFPPACAATMTRFSRGAIEII